MEKWEQVALLNEQIESITLAIRDTQMSVYKDIVRLKSGHLVKDMFNHFVEKKNGTLKPDRNIWIYSAHDYTMLYFLQFLGFPRYVILLKNTYFSIFYIEHMNQFSPGTMSIWHVNNATNVSHFTDMTIKLSVVNTSKEVLYLNK